MHFKVSRKISFIIAVMSVIASLFLFSPAAVAAGNEDITQTESSTTTEPEKDKFLITDIAVLSDKVTNQKLVAYQGKTPYLPETVSVTVETGESINVSARWTADRAFDNKVAGTYIYSLTLDSGYKVKEDIVLPQITVNVLKCASKITGVVTSYDRKARGTITNKVYVANGVGRELKLQMLSDGKWITEKTFKLNSSSSQSVTVTFSDSWWRVTSSEWRMYIEEDAGAYGCVTQNIKIKTGRYYQNPKKYIQIQDDIKIDNSGSYTLKSGYMGLKVRQVNRYFGIGDRYWPRYTSTTKAKVKAFQRKKGLKATGNVDKKTWLKMGYSAASWKNLGAYVSPIKVNPSSTKKQHIEAMIDRAYDYLGSDYVVGASGTPRQGADCSGLVMQSLYAAGIEIPGINPVTHSRAGHEFESRNMWKCKKFKKVKYKNKKRGDLIFYKGPSGYVNHIAIYLGNGKVIEAWPNKVRIANVNHQAIKGVRRVFV